MFPHITDSYTVSEQQLAELITRAEFEHVFGLRRTTAYIRLKELEKMGEIRPVGNGKETKYVGKEKSFP